MTTNEHPIIRLEQNLVFENNYIAVYDDAVLMPDGSEGTYLRITESQGRPGVAILPIAADLIGVVRTFRYASAHWEWSIPRGFAHSGDPAASARRELVEEIGREPDGLVPLGIITPNSGLLSSRVHVFLASYAQPVSAPQDVNEVREVAWLSSTELFARISSGSIMDSFTLSAVTLAVLQGNLQVEPRQG